MRPCDPLSRDPPGWLARFRPGLSLRCPPEQGFNSSRSRRGRSCQEVTDMVHDSSDVPEGPVNLDSV